MKYHKMLAAFLAMVLAVTMLAGCGKTLDEHKIDEPETTPTQTEEVETTEPETTVPETTVPETTVPETTVPETTVPETTEPETTAPAENDSFFYFYDYEAGEYIASDVATYQTVTGEECFGSSLDLAFLEGDFEYTTEGYDERYGVFLYEYNEDQLNSYTSYLTSVGYTFAGEEQFTQGISYYYKNEVNGYTVDLFVFGEGMYLAIEPYLNAPAGNADESEATEPEVYDSYFYFYDYESGEYIASDVPTFQALTEAVCIGSSLDFSFLEGDFENTTEGYDERYGVFLYEYNEDQLNSYKAYLTSIDFTLINEESYTQGTSCYYKNEANGYMFDLFVAAGEAYIAIEPYTNGAMQ